MSLFLNALHGRNFQKCPVWFMRQAGRYLPSYQKMRQTHSLLSMFKTPSLAHKVTLLPFDDLDLDAAIIFSDILVIFEALGFSVDYPQVGGPQVHAPCDIHEILSSLKRHDVKSSLSYVFESIQRVKPDLSVPLLGFSATPFTLLAYLLQKPMKEDIHQVKEVLYRDQALAKCLLEVLTNLVIDYAHEQVLAGIDGFQLFDTASTWLSDDAFKTFSLPYTEKVLKSLDEKKMPTILFSKSSLQRVGDYNSLSLNAVSADWTTPFEKLRSELKPEIGIQGNLDPYLTTLDFSYIEPELENLLNKTRGMPNFIFNLGHGVLPSTKLKTLQSIISYIKAHHVATGGIEQRMASGLP